MTLIAELTKADEARTADLERRFQRLSRDLASGLDVSLDSMREILTASGHSAEDLTQAVAGLAESDRLELIELQRQETEAATALADHDRTVADKLEPLADRAAKLEAELATVRDELAGLKAENRLPRQGLRNDLGAAQARAGRLRERLAVTAQQQLEAKRRASADYESATQAVKRSGTACYEARSHVRSLTAELANLKRRQEIASNEYQVAMRAVAQGYGSAPGGAFGGSMVGASAPFNAPVDGSKQFDAKIAAVQQQLTQAEGWVRDAEASERQAREQLEKIDRGLAQAT